jgi:hypothetical protein
MGHQGLVRGICSVVQYMPHEVFDDIGNNETQDYVCSLIGSDFFRKRYVSFVYNCEIAVRSAGTVLVHT